MKVSKKQIREAVQNHIKQMVESKIDYGDNSKIITESDIRARIRTHLREKIMQEKLDEIRNPSTIKKAN